MRNGLICYPMSGTIDGINSDHILIVIPFMVKEDKTDLSANSCYEQ